MAIASFEELCKGLCEIAGMAPPVLEPDEHGTLAFTVHMREVAVSVMSIGVKRLDTAFLMAELGPLPKEHALEGWRALMQANLQMLGENPSTFSRNPETGDVVLQRACPLARVTATDVYQQVVEMVELAFQWRQDYFLGKLKAKSLAPARA